MAESGALQRGGHGLQRQEIQVEAALRQAVDKAIAGSATLADFRRQFDNIVARHGWDYQGGRDWRTRVIYQTNLSTSHDASRWQQMTDPDMLKARPYWRYVSIRSAPSGVLTWNDENKCPLMNRWTLNLERDLAYR